MWVAVGDGTTYTIAYSTNGTTWTGVTGSASIFLYGTGIAWNGTMWVATGNGTYSIAYSPDGIHWTGVPASSPTIFSTGYNVEWNKALGSVNITTPIVLNEYGSGLSNTLDVVSGGYGGYYNTGFSNFSITISGL